MKEKEKALAQVKQLGKIGGIFALISKIAAIAGLTILIICAIVVACIPDGILDMKYNEVIDMNVNLDAIGETLSEKEQKQLMEEYEKATENTKISVDGTQFAVELMEVTEDNMHMAVKSNSVNVTAKGKILIWLCLLMIYIGLLLSTTIFAGKLCKSFKNCESPFEANVVKSITHMAYALIPWIFGSGLNDSVRTILFAQTFTLSVDLSMVLIVLIVLALAYVFKYGAVLQQESDETL